MKANELRINNWVDVNGHQRQLNPSDFYGLSVAQDDYQPIPLTKEWLERFGFIHNDKYCRYDSKMWNVRNRPEGKEISMNVWKVTGKKDDGFWGVTLREELTFDDVTPTAIQYVHQLQNLYFALTGEELNQNKDE